MRKIYLLSFLFIINFALQGGAQVEGDQLFDNSKIHELKIISLKENLGDTLETNYIMSYGMNQIQTREIPYAAVKLMIDGTTLDSLGIRYKGFNSWWHSTKKPIKIDLNRYKDNQVYDGLKKFNLHNGSGDPSFIRENIDYKLLRLMGIKAPRTAYARVFMDDEYLGLYRLVEQVDNTFLDTSFGNHTGNLFKQHSKSTAGFSLSWLGNSQDLYYSSLSLENHQNENNWADVIHFLDILNNSNDRQFKDSILSVFDVYEYLKILAFDVAVNNLDYYGNSGRNYYLYNNNGLFHWIPWDYNLSWRENAPPVDINPDDFPVLTNRILQIPEFGKAYLENFCQLKTYFSAQFIDKLITDEANMINAAMENDPSMDYPFEAFQQNIESNWQNIPGLKTFAAQRYTDISAILETLKIDCKVTGNESKHLEYQLTVFPVPATDWVNVEIFPLAEISVAIYNSTGQKVMQTSAFGSAKIDISNLLSGCYILKAGVGKSTYSKMLITHH